MKIGIFGTGVVSRTVSAKLAELGHELVMGTRDPAVTLARAEPDRYGGASFKDWHAEHTAIRVATFADAAAHGELLVNATNGDGSLPALQAAGEANLAG